MDTVFHMCSNKHSNRLLLSSGEAPADAAQNAMTFVITRAQWWLMFGALSIRTSRSRLTWWTSMVGSTRSFKEYFWALPLRTALECPVSHAALSHCHNNILTSLQPRVTSRCLGSWSSVFGFLVETKCAEPGQFGDLRNQPCTAPRIAKEAQDSTGSMGCLCPPSPLLLKICNSSSSDGNWNHLLHLLTQGGLNHCTFWGCALPCIFKCKVVECALISIWKEKHMYKSIQTSLSYFWCAVHGLEEVESVWPLRDDVQYGHSS